MPTFAADCISDQIFLFGGAVLMRNSEARTGIRVFTLQATWMMPAS